MPTATPQAAPRRLADRLAGLVYRRAYLPLRQRLDLWRIRRGLDMQAFDAICRQHADTEFGVFKGKYLDFDAFMIKTLHQVYHLGLHRPGPRLRILDIGTGAGYFPFVCNVFGHMAEGTEMENDESLFMREREDAPSMYSDLIRFFGVARTRWTVRPNVPAPAFDGRYDLVTALAVWFDIANQDLRWGVAEWKFFLEDMAKNLLTDDGGLCLYLNPPYKKSEENDRRLSRVQSFFRDNGAAVDGLTVVFPNLKTFR